MKTNENKFRKRGIEYLHSMKPIFNPQWPATLHAKKLAEFCELYRKPNMTIDQFATKFKRSLRQLRYNDIQISPTTAKHTFLQGLGSEFIPIRNMSDLPADYQTDDIDALTKASREHLARVLGNREIQRQQQRQNQTRPPTRTNPPPPPAPSPAPPSNQPPTSTETQPNAPPPSSPHQPTTAQPDFQKEIMREIGFRAHTPARIAYWQQLAGDGMCYYHRTRHSSQTCTRILRATERANAGLAPSSTFIPNPRFQTTAPPTPPPYTPSNAPQPPQAP